MLKKSIKPVLAPQKESTFGCSCRLWLLSWRRARVFARSCSLLSKYLPISWKQRKEQSHAQCHVTHRTRIFDKISEHVKVAESVDIVVPELAVTWKHSTQGEYHFENWLQSVFNPFNIHYITCLRKLSTFTPIFKIPLDLLTARLSLNLLIWSK